MRTLKFDDEETTQLKWLIEQASAEKSKFYQEFQELLPVVRAMEADQPIDIKDDVLNTVVEAFDIGRSVNVDLISQRFTRTQQDAIKRIEAKLMQANKPEHDQLPESLKSSCS